MYRNIFAFVLILYSATLLNLLALIVFLWNLRIFYIAEHVTCKQRVFHFFLSNFFVFSFSCIISLARLSNIMLILVAEMASLPCFLRSFTTEGDVGYVYIT